MTAFDEARLRSSLHDYFGFSQFRPLQQEIVQTVLEGKDCLAILPTGGGKSLCFQLPGLLFPGTTLVISPLISLMTDQVAHLRHKQIPAVALTSALSPQEMSVAMQQLKSGKIKFIYVSPEKLHSTSLLEVVRELRISLVVVDEAHCISEWGHQFRPEYCQIHQFLEKLPTRPGVAAFTASATPKTVQDIVLQLRLCQPKLFRQSVLRQNLSLQVLPCPTQTIQHLVLFRLLKQYGGKSVIIYCATRQQTEDTASQLTALGFLACAYHGGLESDERQQIQQQFLKSRYRIICATTAFGMGVDKPDIRCVIHLNQPASIEGYYQEIGRAGRDGLPSECYLLALPGDARLHLQIIDRSYPPAKESKMLISYLLSKKVTSGQGVTLRQLTHLFMEQKLSARLRTTLSRGEEHGWWSVDRAQKTLFIHTQPNVLRQQLQQLTRQHLFQLYKLKQMKQFTETSSCRMRQLLLYFEPIEERVKLAKFRCHQCDVCRGVAVGEPSKEELIYFRRLHRRLSPLKRQKGFPILMGLCAQLLAVHQPASTENVAQLNIFGRGWRKRWGFIVNMTDTAAHR